MASPCDPVEKVVLTEEEERQAIYNAKWQKYELIRKRDADMRAQRNIDFFFRPWSAEEYFDFIRYRASVLFDYEFAIDKSNEAVIELLCYYFTNDERFISFGREVFEKEYSLTKGIWLRGANGCGKSDIMRLFASNPKLCYDFVRTEVITSTYRDQGDTVIERMSMYREQKSRSADYFYQDKTGVCFDDFGVEEPATNFGPPVLVMQKVIQSAYTKKAVPWFVRHATTMLTPDDVQNKYGSHVRSRIREMFNDVFLDGPDRRI